jgi:hypothetical protein
VGKSKDGLVDPLKPVSGNFIKEQGQDDRYGELDDEPPETDQAGIPESPKKQGSRKDIPKVLKIVPGTSRDALGIAESFEDQLDAINGKIGKDNIECRQGQYQNIKVTVGIDPPAKGRTHDSSFQYLERGEITGEKPACDYPSYSV